MANQPNAPPTRGQKAFAAAVAAGALSYLLLAITGIIKPANRLTPAELGMAAIAAVAIGAALRPALFDRLQKFDFAGLKFELSQVKMSQMEVQKQQQEQQAILEDVRLALQLVIGKKAQDHLVNLFKRDTSYRVKGSLRQEIRSLRGMRLVKMVSKDKRVADMPENEVFDLASYIELTEDGLKFARRLANPADAQAKDASATG